MTETKVKADITLGDLREYLRLKACLQELADEAAELRAEMRPVEERLAEQFIMGGVQNMSMDGHTCYVSVDKYANAKRDCREKLIEWARESNMEDMIVLQPASFKAWCKEYISEHGDLPVEIQEYVNVFEKATLRVRRA